MSDGKQYTVGIVGCGRMANLHAEAYTLVPDTQLVAAADIDPDKLDLFSERWSVPQRYRSYEEMLAQADVDIVSVVTLDNLHGPATIAAAEAGARGVFCEKPMAFDLEEADRMIAACDRAGAKLVIDHSMRFEKNFIEVKAMIERGDIGNLRTIRANMLSTDQRDPSSWHSQYVTAGGGELMHNGTHLTDLIRFYAGDPEWVFATVERGNKAITIEDLGAGLFRMDSGCLFFFESGGRRRYGTFEILIEGGRRPPRDPARARATAWGLWAGGPGNPICTAGAGALSRSSGSRSPRSATTPPSTRSPTWSTVSRMNRESVSSGRQGRAALEMIMAVYESQRRGLARVDFPLAIRDNPFGDMLDRGQI